MIALACRAVLLDIDGTLTDGVGGPEIPGAIEAVRRLMDRVPVRYVTNTTSKSRATIEDALRRSGFPVPDDSVVTPTALARKVLAGALGVLIADPEQRAELDWFREVEPARANVVLLATEAHAWTIADLQPAMRALLGGARLYALEQNRVYRKAGEFVTDLGPVAAFLGYAANATWECCGKPSPLLFRALADELGVAPSDLAMVGDDAEFDASGALAAGCGAGVLVRTGKYRAGDETRVTPSPTHVVGSVAELPGMML